MSRTIFSQIQKVKSASSKLSGAKALNLSDDYQGEKRLVLNYEVKRLRDMIEDAQKQHCEAFWVEVETDLSAKVLMSMGY